MRVNSTTIYLKCFPSLNYIRCVRGRCGLGVCRATIPARFSCRASLGAGRWRVSHGWHARCCVIPAGYPVLFLPSLHYIRCVRGHCGLGVCRATPPARFALGRMVARDGTVEATCVATSACCQVLHLP